MTTLVADRFSGGYGSGADVVHEVSLEARSGEITAILGANGAGKTTLLRFIAGALRPRRGRLELDGEDLTHARIRERVGKGITLVPQGRQLFPDLTVRENLVLGAYLARREVRTTIERVFDLFAALKLKQGAVAASLSGGEQQMLAVGRGLMSNPRVILLDEACIGVAPRLRRSIYETALEMASSIGLAVIASEQEIELALAYASKVYVLQQGRVVLVSAAGELRKDDERLRTAYLGM